MTNIEKQNPWEVVVNDQATKFQGTNLEKRALKRKVVRLSSGEWIVDGDPKLGDAYPDYGVMLNDVTGEYQCSCYSHGQGDVRRRKMCSHALAVVLSERSTGKVVTKATKARRNVLAEMWESEPMNPEEVMVQSVEVDRGSAARGDARGAGGTEGGGADSARKYDAAEGYGGQGKNVTSFTDLPLEAPIPQDDLFGTPLLPNKFSEFRPNQWAAIYQVIEHFNNGVKVVMLSAPTGSGKTLVGEAVRRLMSGRATYSCTTKSLQDQTVRDFDYAKVIKGRSNYPTEYRSDLTADDCTGKSENSYECDWCSSRDACPYQIAKQDAYKAKLPVLNIAYLLAETSTSVSSLFKGRALAIIDEADTLEGQLMSYIELSISARLREEIGVDSLPKKTVPADWVRWLMEGVVPGIQRHKNVLANRSRAMAGSKIANDRRIKQLSRLQVRIAQVIKQGPDGAMLENGWVMTGYDSGSKPTITFKPIKVDEHAYEVLWGMAEQFLLMSATFVSPEQTAVDLGLEEHEWEVVTLESTFPIERRPVFIENVAPMTQKQKETSWPMVTDAVRVIVEDNPGVRILVHTVSYKLSQYIYETLQGVDSGRTLKYDNARDRARVLKQFLEVSDAVLLAPSFDRGIDLPGEDCQVIVIAKVPYPYLGDKQVSARLYSEGGRNWYAVQTIRSIAQMTGRGMRSAEDWCDTYILDSSFRRLYRENKGLFPKWWRDALVLSKTDPKYRGLIKAARDRRVGRG